jgi:hypothetical protein
MGYYNFTLEAKLGKKARKPLATAALLAWLFVHGLL